MQRSPRFDWPLLVTVRESRRDAARDLLAREQRVAAEHQGRVQQADAAWRAQLSARDAHAARLRSQFSASGASVADLRHGGAWDGTLNRRIVEHARRLDAARRQQAEHQQVLAEKRRALLKADAQLDHAREMRDRQRRQVRHALELRLEDALDETGTQAWQRVQQGEAA